MNAAPILPPGIRIGSCIAENEEPAIRIDLRAQTGQATIDAHVTIAPRQARALAALLLRQADLIEQRPSAAWGLRLVTEEGS